MKLLIVCAATLLACDIAPDANKFTAPAVSCNSNDDAGGACAPPVSGCADQHWIYYYDDGQCVDNQCKWTTKFFDCHDDHCYGGRCNYDGETAPYTYGP